MEPRLHFEPQGRLSRMADSLMMPIMYLASGTLSESPQCTHPWNLKNFLPRSFPRLDPDMTVQCKQVSAVRRWFFLFHIPILGGWRDYVVLEPTSSGEWFVGWVWSDSSSTGISRIPLKGSVRVLLGSCDLTFFGTNKDGIQIAIKKIGEGKIGDGGPYAHIPLR